MVSYRNASKMNGTRSGLINWELDMLRIITKGSHLRRSGWNEYNRDLTMHYWRLQLKIPQDLGHSTVKKAQKRQPDYYNAR
jgi:hypothetical protein